MTIISYVIIALYIVGALFSFILSLMWYNTRERTKAQVIGIGVIYAIGSYLGLYILLRKIADYEKFYN